MLVALYGQKLLGEHYAYFQHMIDKLENSDCRIMIYSPLFAESKDRIRFHREPVVFSGHEGLKGADLLISVGGDGTLLGTIPIVRDSGLPVLGLNTGKMGFLASISKEDVIHSIDEIHAKRYSLDERTLVGLEMENNPFGETSYGLNEVMIYKHSPMSMITVHTWVDGDFLNAYWGDGLIISTPTGSTGYSMSCGGPIVLPGSGSFVITPIATHNLTVRPVVIPDSSTIRIRVECRDQKYFAGIDSRSFEISHTNEIIVRKENFTLKLLNLENQNFFKTIRAKLKWGIDVRN